MGVPRARPAPLYKRARRGGAASVREPPGQQPPPPPRSRFHSPLINRRERRRFPHGLPPRCRRQHEGVQPGAVGEEERSLGAPAGHLPQQDARGRPHEPAVQHERLLLEAEGAGAQHPAEQEGQQDGNPAARHRLHPGPADRAGLAPQHRQPPPPAARAEPRRQDPAHHAQHGHQHPLHTGGRIPLGAAAGGPQGAVRLSPAVCRWPRLAPWCVFFVLHKKMSTVFCYFFFFF